MREFCYVPQLSSLESVDRIVCSTNIFHERLHIHFVVTWQNLCPMSPKNFLSPLLNAAVNDHVTELLLLAWLDVQLVQFVHGFLEVQWTGLSGR